MSTSSGAATITLSQPAVCTITVGTTNTTATLTVTEPAGLELALSEC